MGGGGWGEGRGGGGVYSLANNVAYADLIKVLQCLFVCVFSVSKGNLFDFYMDKTTESVTDFQI